jgi:type I restriction enzyme M protein
MNQKQSRIFQGRGLEMGTGWFFNWDKASLYILWIRDETLEESDNLPDPDVLAQEIVEDLEAALEQFREIASDLGSAESGKETE